MKEYFLGKSTPKTFNFILKTKSLELMHPVFSVYSASVFRIGYFDPENILIENDNK